MQCGAETLLRELIQTLYKQGTVKMKEHMSKDGKKKKSKLPKMEGKKDSRKESMPDMKGKKKGC